MFETRMRGGYACRARNSMLPFPKSEGTRENMGTVWKRSRPCRGRISASEPRDRKPPMKTRLMRKSEKNDGNGYCSHFGIRTACYKGEMNAVPIAKKKKKVGECLPGNISAPGTGDRKRAMVKSEPESEWVGGSCARRASPASHAAGTEFRVPSFAFGVRYSRYPRFDPGICETKPTAVTDRRHNETKPFQALALCASASLRFNNSKPETQTRNRRRRHGSNLIEVNLT